MKKIILILVIIIILLGTAIFVLQKNQSETSQVKVNEMPSEKNQQVIGGQRDEHGCLGPAGYSWCEAKQKCLREWEEPCENEDIFAFLQKIKDDTGLTLSGIAPVNVFWKIKLSDGQIIDTMHSGRGMGMSESSLDNINKIQSYLLSKGYNLDKQNTLTGTEIISEGYILENKICVLTANSMREDNRAEFSIDCAETNLAEYQNYNVEELKNSIKSQIINKRGASASNLVIKISKLYGDFASGGAMPPIEGVGGGMWIGAKVDNKWQLVWDGNGSILCTDINPYPTLPREIVPECYDQANQKLVER